MRGKIGDAQLPAPGQEWYAARRADADRALQKTINFEIYHIPDDIKATLEQRNMLIHSTDDVRAACPRDPVNP